MTDILTPEQRKKNMSAIRGKDTKPELAVRSMVHRLGFRYRLHRRDLPGTPDLLFPKHHKVIFVHGCYWHVHDCPYGKVIPKTNTEFWTRKRSGNKQRDERNIKSLIDAGFDVLIIWECQIKDAQRLRHIITGFLGIAQNLTIRGQKCHDSL